jgi:hypothetical protein
MSEYQAVLFRAEPGSGNVRLLERVLEDDRGWSTARALARIMFGQESDNALRQVRALAEGSAGWIISGQRGYKHVRCATAEELQHAAAWLESQAQKMSARACAIRRRAHEVMG